MSLWLCLRFDALPLEALLAQQGLQGNTTTVVVADRRVLLCDEQASLSGVLPGQSMHTAQALLAEHSARFLDRLPDAEAALLEQLKIWAYGISPHLQQWHDDALMIEIGSCLKLHHGLNTLLRHIDHEMNWRGLTVAMGVAETRTAAWVLSYADVDTRCRPEQTLTERLAPLPLNLIATEFPEIVARLEKTGIYQFGQLLSLPLQAIGKRCGASFVKWLNQLTGSQQEASVIFQPPVRFEDTLWFGFEVHNRQELYPAMERLLAHFCRFLMNTQLSCGVIEWRYLQPKSTLQPDNAPSAPSLKVFSETAQQHAKRWFDLSCLRLESQSLPEGIEGLTLTAEQLQEASHIPQDLFHTGISKAARHELTDRLRSRLGLKAVGYLDYRQEHLPEEAVIETHAISTQHELDPMALGQRPFWLLPDPHPIHQTAQRLYWNGALEIIHGPERIEDQWWRTPISRDYYIARTPQQQPIWIYQDRHNRRWYLHGLFA